MRCIFWMTVLFLDFFVFPCRLQAGLRVAVLYSKTSGSEYICMINEFFKNHAQDITSHVFDYHDSAEELVKLSKNIGENDYDLVVGPRTSEEALLTAPIFQKHEVPQILPGASLEILTRDYANVVRIVGNSDQYARKAALYFTQVETPGKILVVSNLSNPFSAFYRSAFPKYFSGINPDYFAYYDYVSGSQNFSEVVEIIKSTNADLVYAPIYDLEIAELYKVLANSGLKIKIFTHAGLLSMIDVMAGVRSDRVQLYFNGLIDADSKRIQNKEFFNLCTLCKLNTNSVRGVLGYETAGMILKNYKNYPDFKGLKRVNSILGMEYDGLLGPWIVDESRSPIRPLHIFKLDNGRTEYIYSVQ